MNAKYALVFLVCVTAFGCSTAKEKPESLKSNMHNLSEGLSNLLPLIYDPLQFSDPSNRDILEREVTRLSRFDHQFKDPALNLVGRRFTSEMQEARRQLNLGNISSSRAMLRNATNYCISCHTQSKRGPEFTVDAANPFYKKLNALDRTVYLIAIRSFDEAMTEFDRAMNSPDVALLPFQALESATLKILAVAVRVKKDSHLAERIVLRMNQSKWAPVYLQLSGLEWLKSIREWSRSPNTPATLPEAKRLISTAVKKQMDSPFTRAGLIDDLRASAILHEWLEGKQRRDLAEAYYYAGLASESLKGLDLLDISDRYFETCIREKPHSAIARNCYVRLESAQMASSLDADSGRLPGAVRDKLDELKRLAETPGQPWGRP